MQEQLGDAGPDPAGGDTLPDLAGEIVGAAAARDHFEPFLNHHAGCPESRSWPGPDTPAVAAADSTV